MLERAKLKNLDDYFLGLSRRKGAYFYRLNGYNAKIDEFVRRYYEAARVSGVVIEGKIQNPTPENLVYYDEILGRDFRMDPVFMENALKKWLPRMNPMQRKNVVSSIYDVLVKLGRSGKNENMLKNAYIRSMCWLYYKFEQAALHLGEEKLPKILYEGSVSVYELLFLDVLANAGCDILLLQYAGDDEYLKLDPNSLISYDYRLADMSAFPGNFNIRQIRSDLANKQKNERLYGDRPQKLVQVTTDAYNAERELDKMLYQDTGMYRDKQHGRANAMPMQTMYEEIELLWDQELKFRPGFEVTDGVVNMPVIFAKVSGVRQVSDYWNTIRKFVTPDAIVISKLPHVSANNPIKPFATKFLKNKKVQRGIIKAHSAYRYGLLRDEMQEHLLDKLELLIYHKIIKGTFEVGVEYTIIAVALNLDTDTLQKVQSFDFTKKNPKLIYVLTGETQLSLEDTIYTVFLNLVGFDIVFFVPTGYRCIEKHLNKNYIVEHQIGQYEYNLTAPNLSSPQNTHSWLDIIFKRDK